MLPKFVNSKPRKMGRPVFRTYPVLCKHKGGRMIFHAWAAEFALECIGSALYYNKNKLLSVLLAFCAVGDATTCLIYQAARQTLYANSYWIARSGKYLLLVWLA